MRLESKRKLKVKGTTIGGGQPLVCLPIMAGSKADLLDQARQSVCLEPDLIEWRIDGYGGVLDIQDCTDTLETLQGILGQVPLIVTCRIAQEGGMGNIPDQSRLDLILAAIRTGCVDIIDTELCNGDAFIKTVVHAAKASGTKVLLSYHDFEATPAKGVILEKLTQAQALGADIAKLAAMPRAWRDVLTLMEATLTAREEGVQIPMVTISMGQMGIASRLAGGIFGSDITFAMAETASAPGQIPIAQLKQAMPLLYS